METLTKNILVAPLNWGLGHATRCIPIIRELEKNGFTPILASDGDALLLLQKEFPHLQFLKLPSYKIEYGENGTNFKWKLLKNSPKIIQAITPSLFSVESELLIASLRCADTLLQIFKRRLLLLRRK